MQAEEGAGSAARAFIYVVQAKPAPNAIWPIEIMRGVGPARQAGKPLVRRAQGLDQWCILPAMKPAEPKPPRDERLAAALRENLKRRKARARAKEEVPKPNNDKDKTGG